MGSDFDGADNTYRQVAGYASLPEMLLKRGFTDHESQSICSGNALGVVNSVYDWMHISASDGRIIQKLLF